MFVPDISHKISMCWAQNNCQITRVRGRGVCHNYNCGKARIWDPPIPHISPLQVEESTAPVSWVQVHESQSQQWTASSRESPKPFSKLCPGKGVTASMLCAILVGESPFHLWTESTCESHNSKFRLPMGVRLRSSVVDYVHVGMWQFLLLVVWP